MQTKRKHFELEDEEINSDAEEELFVEAKQLDSEKVVEKICSLTADFVEALVAGEDFQLSLVRRDNRNVLWDESGKLRLGMQKQNKSLLARGGVGLRRYCQIWKIMAFVQKLLQEKKQCTQREAYYCMVKGFTSQQEFNQALLDVVALFECSRQSLGICAASSGSIAGSVLWNDGNNVAIDCTQVGSTGKRIPGNVEEVSFNSLGARYIIVVEKDAVFTYLCEHRLWETLPCVLVTGCGYPPLSVRRVVKTLADNLCIPVLGLFDYNPHGIRILLTYRFGSVRMGMEGHAFATPIKWLGLHRSDVFSAGEEDSPVPSSALQEWTTADDRVYKNLVSMPFCKVNTRYKEELERMSHARCKAEIEALNSTDWNTVATMVVRKILRRQYF